MSGWGNTGCIPRRPYWNFRSKMEGGVSRTGPKFTNQPKKSLGPTVYFHKFMPSTLINTPMGKVLTICLTLVAGPIFGQNGPQDIYGFQVETLQGETFDLGSLKGKKVMIVNTASKCGLTRQYEQLQELYQRYQTDGFVILGFPANNFAGQEPGSNEEIEEFCKANYGVSFPMMAKISVKGEDMHPLYKFLTQKERNGFQDS